MSTNWVDCSQAELVDTGSAVFHSDLLVRRSEETDLETSSRWLGWEGDLLLKNKSKVNQVSSAVAVFHCWRNGEEEIRWGFGYSERQETVEWCQGWSSFTECSHHSRTKTLVFMYWVYICIQHVIPVTPLSTLLSWLSNQIPYIIWFFSHILQEYSFSRIRWWLKTTCLFFPVVFWWWIRVQLLAGCYIQMTTDLHRNTITYTALKITENN